MDTDKTNLEKEFLSTPNIFDYKDYRAYLKDWFEAKKAQSNYSATLFAKDAGLKSHTLFQMVVRKKRNLTYNTIRSFSKALNLKMNEKRYFESLVLFNQSKRSDEKNDLFQQLASLSRQSNHSLLQEIQDYQKYYSHWYMVAIREMVNLKDFQADPEWIAKKLKNKITKKQAETAWSTLLKINLVKWNESTKSFELPDPTLDFGSESVNFIIQKFHKEYLNRSLSAIDEDKVEDRELSSLTIAVNEDIYQEIKKKIQDFRKYINLIYTKEKKEKPEKLIAVNMQLLKLTNNDKEKQKKERS